MATLNNRRLLGRRVGMGRRRSCGCGRRRRKGPLRSLDTYSRRHTIKHKAVGCHGGVGSDGRYLIVIPANPVWPFVCHGLLDNINSNLSKVRTYLRVQVGKVHTYKSTVCIYTGDALGTAAVEAVLVSLVFAPFCQRRTKRL
jgi:hypothetical protein